MKRKLALVLSATMIMTSVLTGCTKNSGDDSSSSSSSKGGQYKSAETYTKEDHDNAGEDLLGSLDGKALTFDSKWDDTFGKDGFEFDSDEGNFSYFASSDDYEGVSLTVWFYCLDDEKDVKVEDIKNDGMKAYIIDASHAENKPEMTWKGLTWGASAEDIIKAYGEPDDKSETSLYDSYRYEYGDPRIDYSVIEFCVYHGDSSYDTGLQQVAVSF